MPSHADSQNKFFAERMASLAHTVDEYLYRCLEGRFIPPRLRDSMLYSLHAGGKRLRPVLFLACAGVCGMEDAPVSFAAAIEMIHTYSLIHDDLPAMDDDDLRRGQPSNHRAFDEATAILAGDSLLTDAFALMCQSNADATRLLEAVATMSQAAGSSGMTGGQMLDMLQTGQKNMDCHCVHRLHAMKTGALISASCVCGAILAGATKNERDALASYGAALGAAFQITDDILDVMGDSRTLGKPAHSDEVQGKMTYPALYGLKKSRSFARDQCDIAIESLSLFIGPDADFLRSLAVFSINRLS